MSVYGGLVPLGYAHSRNIRRLAFCFLHLTTFFPEPQSRDGDSRAEKSKTGACRSCIGGQSLHGKQDPRQSGNADEHDGVQIFGFLDPVGE